MFPTRSQFVFPAVGILIPFQGKQKRLRRALVQGLRLRRWQRSVGLESRPMYVSHTTISPLLSWARFS